MFWERDLEQSNYYIIAGARGLSLLLRGLQRLPGKVTSLWRHEVKWVLFSQGGTLVRGLSRSKHRMMEKDGLHGGYCRLQGEIPTVDRLSSVNMASYFPLSSGVHSTSWHLLVQ